MSILNLVVAPDTSWLEVVDACSHYGVPCALFVDKDRSLRKDPSQGSAHYVGPLRVLYLEDLEAFRMNHIVEKLESSRKYQYLVMVGTSPMKFQQVPVYEGSVRSFVAAHFEIANVAEGIDISFNSFDHHAELMKKYQRDSVLSRVSQLLYRIKDKVQREKVANAVYLYLSGGRVKKPETTIKQLDEVLVSDVAKRYIQAGYWVRRGSPIDLEAKTRKVDRFELGYCIRKTTTDEELLEHIAFKD